VGAPDLAPFDRIIVTAACKHVPVSWWKQLRPGGVLVLPLRRGPVNFSVFSLVRTEDGFAGERTVMGGFMPMQGGAGPPPGLRYLGSRKDFALLKAGSVTRLEEAALVRLLSTGPRTETPAELAQAFPPDENPRPGEWIDLQAFVAASTPQLLMIMTRTELYGFSAGIAVLDLEDDSLTVLAPNRLGAGRPRNADFKPELLAFGGSRAAGQVRERLRRFVLESRPRHGRLRLSLVRTRSRAEPWRYEYGYAAAPAERP
jgi:hypothetical protein